MNIHLTTGDQNQLQLKSIHKRLLRRVQSQEQQPDDSVQAPYSGTEANDDMQETYEALCRGEQKRVDKVIPFVTASFSRITCRLMFSF